MNKEAIIVAVVVLYSFILAGIVWGIMPPMMASHWNIAGEVDGFMPRPVALLMMPVLGLVLAGLFWLLPRLDPFKENIVKFGDVYKKTVVAVFAFLFYVYVLTIAWNLGYPFSLPKFLVPAFAILFFILGQALRKTKRNWVMGIRTPWTLSSDRVWKKTHDAASKIFTWLGTLTLISLFFRPEVIFAVVIVGTLAAVLYLFAYSYLEFRKETRD